MTQTDGFATAIQTRVERQLAANGLNEIATGLLLLAANGPGALKEAGFQAFENPWVVGSAAIALLLALAGVPMLRRRYVDPRLGFARPPFYKPAAWIAVAAAVLVYVFLLRIDVNGPLLASVFPIALAHMARRYAAPRLYIAAVAVSIAMLALTQLSLTSTGWLSCTAFAAAVALISTGTFAFVRFVRTTPELEAVTP
ncbi:MAG TPA: hypothetical protein VER03_01315 [Bryobacteraceae bacterium]|nr:hypothetical protein [Bryobacteraceae bacterium]